MIGAELVAPCTSAGLRIHTRQRRLSSPQLERWACLCMRMSTGRCFRGPATST